MKVSADQYKPMQLEFESKAFFRKAYSQILLVIAAYITVALLLLGIIDFIWIDLPWTLIGTVSGYILAQKLYNLANIVIRDKPILVSITC